MPILYVDPLGLFTDTTRISISSNNGSDKDLLDLQARLIGLYYLSPSKISVRGVTSDIHKGINGMKDSIGLENIPQYGFVGGSLGLRQVGNYGVVGITTWHALGLYTEAEKNAVTGMDEEILGMLIAAMLISELLNTKGYPTYTLLAKYYNDMKCEEVNVKIAEVVSVIPDIAFGTVYNYNTPEYQQMAASCPPWSAAGAAGVAFLQSVGEELVGYPSVVDTDAFIRGLAQSNLSKAVQKYTRVAQSHLAFVFTTEAKDNHRKEYKGYIQDLTGLTNDIAWASNFYAYGVPKDMNQEFVRIAAMEYLLEVLRLNMSFPYKKEYMEGSGLKVN